jgi:hypothetical protein
LNLWVNAKMIYFGSIVVFEVKKLKTEVDYNGRCETPMGIAGRLRPRRSDSDEEAQLTPQGKGATWSCNQLTHFKIRTMYTKQL